MRFLKLFACLIAIDLLASLPILSQTPTTQTPAAKPHSTATKPATAPYDRTLLKPALLKDTAPDTYQVKFETTRGDFTITVTRAWSPNGADRF